MKHVVFRGNLYEAAEPWMNSSEVLSRLDHSDFTMGFECEMVVKLGRGGYEYPEMEQELDEDAYLDAISEKTSELMKNPWQYVDTPYEPFVNQKVFEKYCEDQDEEYAFVNTYHLLSNDEEEVVYTFGSLKADTIRKFIKELKKQSNVEEFQQIIIKIYEIVLDVDFEDAEDVDYNYYINELIEQYVLYDASNTIEVYDEENGTDLLRSFRLIMGDGAEFEKYRISICEKIYYNAEDLARDDANKEVDVDDYYSNVESNGYNDKLTENKNTAAVDLVADEIEKAFGVDVSRQYEYTDSEDWAVKFDSSISPDNEDEGGAEIASPPEDLDTSLDNLDTIFTLINDLGYTNSSTGLHLSINQESVHKKDQNWLKLAVFFNDKYFTKMFGREHSGYNRTLFGFFENLKMHNKTYRLPDDLAKLESDFAEYASKDRYAINYRNTNYYEFRVSGGEDYQDRFEEVKRNVLLFCGLIQISSTDEYNDIYVRKLSSLLNRKPSKPTNNYLSQLSNYLKTGEKSKVSIAAIEHYFKEYIKNHSPAIRKMLLNFTDYLSSSRSFSQYEGVKYKDIVDILGTESAQFLIYDLFVNNYGTPKSLINDLPNIRLVRDPNWSDRMVNTLYLKMLNNYRQTLSDVYRKFIENNAEYFSNVIGLSVSNIKDELNDVINRT